MKPTCLEACFKECFFKGLVEGFSMPFERLVAGWPGAGTARPPKARSGHPTLLRGGGREPATPNHICTIHLRGWYQTIAGRSLSRCVHGSKNQQKPMVFQGFSAWAPPSLSKINGSFRFQRLDPSEPFKNHCFFTVSALGLLRNTTLSNFCFQ